MEFESIINEQLDSIDLSQLEELQDEALSEIPIADEITVEAIINDLINGQPIFESDKIIDNLKELLLMEVQSSLVLGCEILVVCIITFALHAERIDMGETVRPLCCLEHLTAVFLIYQDRYLPIIHDLRQI